MTGLVKSKQYDWRDSNLAMFGSDTEKEVKKESAESEPAWQGVGQEEGLKIWRIVNFEVTEWPQEDYGKFFSGDSYIILNTYKENPDAEALSYDVHFWIGKHSSQDEYGTVAYKTVELDTFLDDAAVQHREVQGHESETFQDYFEAITIMSGGAATGFRHVEPTEYPARLLRFNGKGRKIKVEEVALNRASLLSEDVFILDNGLQLYQWNGKDANKDERFKAMQYLSQLKGERGSAESETFDEDDTPGSFYDLLTGEEEESEDVPDEEGGTKLYQLVSDASGEMSIEELKDGDVSMDDLVSDDVFIIDVGKQCFVWVGGNASTNEKKNGIPYAHKHLSTSSHPFVPIAIIKEGQKNREFEAVMGIAA